MLMLKQPESKVTGPALEKVAVAANTSLSIYQQVVECTVGNTTTITITLPDVAEAIGRVYSIRAVSVGSSSHVKVSDNDESEAFGPSGNGTDYDMSATGDRVALFSDGKAWVEIQDRTT